MPYLTEQEYQAMREEKNRLMSALNQGHNVARSILTANANGHAPNSAHIAHLREFEVAARLAIYDVYDKAA